MLNGNNSGNSNINVVSVSIVIIIKILSLLTCLLYYNCFYKIFSIFLQITLEVNNVEYQFEFNPTAHTAKEVSTLFCAENMASLGVIGDSETLCVLPIQNALQNRLIELQKNAMLHIVNKSIEINNIANTSNTNSTQTIESTINPSNNVQLIDQSPKRFRKVYNNILFTIIITLQLII